MQIYGGGDKLVTINQLYRLLGIHNLLTDDEMDISKTTKNDQAKQAISNEKYANNISTFHYCGVGGMECINWKFNVDPQTDYRMTISATTSAELGAVFPDNPTMRWAITSNPLLAGNNLEKGDIANYLLPIPWKGTRSFEISFNSGQHSSLYLFAGFGYLSDGVNTDISLQLELLRKPIQSEIDQIQNQLDQPSFNNALPYHKNPLTANDDLNNVLENGIYVLQGQTPKNAPALSGSERWGTLIVWKHDDGQIIQRFFLQDLIYFRWLATVNGTPKSQTEWIKEADARDIENLQNQINQLKK